MKRPTMPATRPWVEIGPDAPVPKPVYEHRNRSAADDDEHEVEADFARTRRPLDFPTPWAEVRRTVYASFRTVGHRFSVEEREELLAIVFVRCAERLAEGLDTPPESIERYTRWLCSYARTIAKRERADLVSGRVRGRGGLGSLTSGPRSSEIADDFDLEATGARLPAPTNLGMTEDMLIEACDLARAAERLGLALNDTDPAELRERAERETVLDASIELGWFWDRTQTWARARCASAMGACAATSWRDLAPEDWAYVTDLAAMGRVELPPEMPAPVLAPADVIRWASSPALGTALCLASGHRPSMVLYAGTSPKDAYDRLYDTVRQGYYRAAKRAEATTFGALTPIRPHAYEKEGLSLRRAA